MNPNSMTSGIRILFTGSRECTDEGLMEQVVFEHIHLKFPLDTVETCQGGAPGADRIIKSVLDKYGIACRTYEANWKLYGKSAGPIRNSEMLVDFKPNLVIALYKIGAANRGTMDMVEKALKKGVKVIIQPEVQKNAEGV